MLIQNTQAAVKENFDTKELFDQASHAAQLFFSVVNCPNATLISDTISLCQQAYYYAKELNDTHQICIFFNHLRKIYLLFKIHKSQSPTLKEFFEKNSDFLLGKKKEDPEYFWEGFKLDHAVLTTVANPNKAIEKYTKYQARYKKNFQHPVQTNIFVAFVDILIGFKHYEKHNTLIQQESTASRKELALFNSIEAPYEYFSSALISLQNCKASEMEDGFKRDHLVVSIQIELNAHLLYIMGHSRKRIITTPTKDDLTEDQLCYDIMIHHSNLQHADIIDRYLYLYKTLTSIRSTIPGNEAAVSVSKRIIEKHSTYLKNEQSDTNLNRLEDALAKKLASNQKTADAIKRELEREADTQKAIEEEAYKKRQKYFSKVLETTQRRKNTSQNTPEETNSKQDNNDKDLQDLNKKLGEGVNLLKENKILSAFNIFQELKNKLDQGSGTNNENSRKRLKVFVYYALSECYSLWSIAFEIHYFKDFNPTNYVKKQDCLNVLNSHTQAINLLHDAEYLLNSFMPTYDGEINQYKKQIEKGREITNERLMKLERFMETMSKHVKATWTQNQDKASPHPIRFSTLSTWFHDLKTKNVSPQNNAEAMPTMSHKQLTL